MPPFVPSFALRSLVLSLVLALSACSTPLKNLFNEDPLTLARTSPVVVTPVQIVPNSPGEAAKLPPQNLGIYSPTGLSTSMTASNTGMQSTQMSPSLATPFVALKSAEVGLASQSAIPLKITNLLKQKDWNNAIKEIEIAIKANPKNVQLVFVKSRVLIDQGQLEQARLTLVSLTEKYPELPEPYNNLAVLYANAGKLELARENLEMSLKLSPNDAIALQNLGDIYSKMASQSYGKAFQNNRRMSEAQRKQKLVDAVTQ